MSETTRTSFLDRKVGRRTLFVTGAGVLGALAFGLQRGSRDVTQSFAAMNPAPAPGTHIAKCQCLTCNPGAVKKSLMA